MPVFVGCDLGTMGTKAAVVDGSGAILAEAFEEVTLYSPRPGQVEQSLDEIEASAHATIRRVLAASGRASDVAGIAFSSQMSGVGAIDAAFRPALAFDSWLDARCAPQVAELMEHAARIVALSGCPPTYSHAPKLRHWLADPRRDTNAVRRITVPGAYAAGRLAGLEADASFIDRTYIHFTNMTDTRQVCWSPELVELVGIDPSWLPRIVAPTDVVGEVSRAGSAATGLPVGTPVAAGAGDQAAAQLGAAAVRPGVAFDSAGTASVFAVCTGTFEPDLQGFTRLAAHAAVDGLYVALSFINGGGLALRWFRDEIATELRGDADAFSKLDLLAQGLEPGAGGLLWFPHFQGRVLPPSLDCRGAWIGLTNGHTLAHLYRAILEGIAFEYATWLEPDHGAVTVAETRAFGGGARSPLWNQIKADVVGAAWLPLDRQECGVLGDALIAARATGHVSDIAATAERWQSIRTRVEPDPERHAAYARLLAAYRGVAPALAPLFSSLARP